MQRQAGTGRGSGSEKQGKAVAVTGRRSYYFGRGAGVQRAGGQGCRRQGFRGFRVQGFRVACCRGRGAGCRGAVVQEAGFGGLGV